MNYTRAEWPLWTVALMGGAVLFLAGFLTWTAKLDEKRMISAEAYEKCVRAEYNTHPTAYYDQHGTWPECDGTPYLDEAVAH